MSAQEFCSYRKNTFFQFTGLDFDVHMSIFVSPIVFPLAFSINGELQEMFFIILLIKVFVRSFVLHARMFYL